MIKIIACSDTHGYHRDIDLPDGDILVYTGDFSRGVGSIEQTKDFNDWLGILSYSEIIFVPGNHDILFESEEQYMRDIMANCDVLIDEEVIVNGIKFYGSPYQPAFLNWGFNLERKEDLKKVWEKIPNDTDVLLTHCPPHRILDIAYDLRNIGCDELAKRVIKVSPKLSVFGHCHEDAGHLEYSGIHFINASVCNIRYNPVNKPWIIEIDKSSKEIISVTN